MVSERSQQSQPELRHPLEATLVALRQCARSGWMTREDLSTLLGESEADDFPEEMREGTEEYDRASMRIRSRFGRPGESLVEICDRWNERHRPSMRRETAHVEIPRVLKRWLTRVAAMENRTAGEWLEERLDMELVDRVTLPQGVAAELADLESEEPGSLVALFYTRYWGPHETQLSAAYEAVAGLAAEERDEIKRIQRR